VLDWEYRWRRVSDGTVSVRTVKLGQCAPDEPDTVDDAEDDDAITAAIEDEYGIGASDSYKPCKISKKKPCEVEPPGMSPFEKELWDALPELRRRAYAVAWKNGRDSSFADELIQRAWMHAIRRQHQYTLDTHINLWLSKILRTVLTAEYRHSNRFKPITAEQEDFAYQAVTYRGDDGRFTAGAEPETTFTKHSKYPLTPAPQFDAEKRYYYKQVLDTVFSTRGLLTDLQQRVMYHTCLERTDAETARIISKAAQTIKNNRYQARKTLNSMLNSMFNTPRDVFDDDWLPWQRQLERHNRLPGRIFESYQAPQVYEPLGSAAWPFMTTKPPIRPRPYAGSYGWRSFPIPRLKIFFHAVCKEAHRGNPHRVTKCEPAPYHPVPKWNLYKKASPMNTTTKPAFNSIQGVSTKGTSMTIQVYAAEIRDGALALLRDKNTTANKCQTKIDNLFAAAKLDAVPPGARLDVASVDSALAGRNLSIPDRIAIKTTLSRNGLL
jgi:DNA-directed RNA polymerase specialized sigma24 family protein